MFSGNIPKDGFLRVFLLAILFSRESSREGSNNKFASIANTRARTTSIIGLKAKGVSKPGIGEAVPGALLTILKYAAESPARAPPVKLDVNIGIGLAVTISA